MKKVAYVVLVLIMAIFLVNPLSSEARDGYSGGGGHGGSGGGGNWSGGGHGGGHIGSGGSSHLGSGTRGSYSGSASVGRGGSYTRGGHWGSGRGSHWGGGGHRGGGGWWPWWPWAAIGGAAVLWPYYSTYYEPYYAPYYEPPVVIQEQPPVDVQPAPSVTPSLAEKIFVYPRLGQSEELQAKDRSECHNWAVSQTQYDPTQPLSGMSEAQLNQMRADYQRAMGACLDGRGYTMK